MALGGLEGRFSVFVRDLLEMSLFFELDALFLNLDRLLLHVPEILLCGAQFGEKLLILCLLVGIRNTIMQRIRFRVGVKDGWDLPLLWRWLPLLSGTPCPYARARSDLLVAVRVDVGNKVWNELNLYGRV